MEASEFHFNEFDGEVRLLWDFKKKKKLRTTFLSSLYKHCKHTKG